MSSGASSPHFNPSESPNYGFMIPERPSPNLRAFLGYCDALHALDSESSMEFFDEDLEHRILPVSLQRPVLNKRQYREYLLGILPLFKSFKLSLHEVIEVDDKLTVHASSVGESIFGDPYHNEYMVVAHFVPPLLTSDANAFPKMRYFKEFVDSAVSTEFFTKVRAKAKRARSAKEKKSGSWSSDSWSTPN